MNKVATLLGFMRKELKTNNNKNLKITWTQVLGVPSSTPSFKAENHKANQTLNIGGDGYMKI